MVESLGQSIEVQHFFTSKGVKHFCIHVSEKTISPGDRFKRKGAITMIANVLSVEVIVLLTLKVLVTTIDAQWEGMGDVGSARYEPALLPPCPTIRVFSYSN